MWLNVSVMLLCLDKSSLLLAKILYGYSEEASKSSSRNYVLWPLFLLWRNLVWFQELCQQLSSVFPFLTSISKTLVCYVNSAVQIAVSHIHHTLGKEVLHLLQLLYAYPHACFSAPNVKVKKIIVKKNKNIFALRRNGSTSQASLVFYCPVYCPFHHAMP